MKDSGVAWIGEVPEGWNCKRIKFLAREPGTLFTDGDWINSDVITDEGVRYLTSGNVGEGTFKEQGKSCISEDTFKKLNCLKVYPGDLLICRLNEPLGRACFVPQGEPYYVVAVDDVVLRPDSNIDKRFVLYCLNNDRFSGEALNAAAGTTMKRISRTDLGNLSIPLPPYKEQSKIAAYLDRECGKIDALVAKTEQQIAALEEYKKSVITEAITGKWEKGPKKDSGVEWIGDVPSGWEIKKTKHVFDVFPGATPDSKDDENWDGDIPWITPADFKTSDHFVSSGSRYITEKGLSSCSTNLLPPGTLIFSKRAPVGTVAISSTILCTNQGCLSCVPHDNVDADYFYYYFSVIPSVFEDFSFGTTFLEISLQNFTNIKLPFPDIKTQNKISSYLDCECSKIDALLVKARQQIAAYQDYKKSLIFECVTGKREVV